MAVTIDVAIANRRRELKIFRYRIDMLDGQDSLVIGEGQQHRVVGKRIHQAGNSAGPVEDPAVYLGRKRRFLAPGLFPAVLNIAVQFRPVERSETQPYRNPLFE